MEQQNQLLEDKLKASNIKAKKGNRNGTTLKSILKKGTPIAKKSNARKNSSKRTPKKFSKYDSPNCGANNNGPAHGKEKKNRKGQKVSFDGKKAATRTNKSPIDLTAQKEMKTNFGLMPNPRISNHLNVCQVLGNTATQE